MSRRVIFLQGPSLLLNPTLDRELIESAFVDDPESARSEWGGQFRCDISAYLTEDIIDRALCPGERSRPRSLDFEHVGFLDAAGGVAGGDAMTAAVAHQEAGGRVVVDQLAAIDAPFDTEVAVKHCSLLLKSFGISSATSDKYAGLWPAQSFQRHGISLTASRLSKAEIYAEVAPLFVSGLVSLVDDQRLEVELRQLERAPRAGGRGDVIDHPPGRGAHDDRINSVAGALWLASKLQWAGRSAQSMLYPGGSICAAPLPIPTYPARRGIRTDWKLTPGAEASDLMQVIRDGKRNRSPSRRAHGRAVARRLYVGGPHVRSTAGAQ